MNKMTWIFIWSVTALAARTTTAISCYWCENLEYKTCGDNLTFVPPVSGPDHNCPSQMTQCYKAKVKAKVDSVEMNLVLRGCAPPEWGKNRTGCYSEKIIIPLPGRTAEATGDWCYCGTDLCNGGAPEKVIQQKAKGNEGEQFQPKMKLLLFTVATALMNILFN